MPHRVIYCAVGCVSLLANFPHDVLRRLDAAVVASLSDETLESIARDYGPQPLIYFSRQAYDDAVRSLADAEIDEVLRRRAERWAPIALERVMDWLARGERPALTLTALVARTATGDPARQLQTHFESGLELLTAIVGAGRYDDMEIVDLLTAAVENEALLMAELGAVPETQTRTGFARALAQELKRHGRPEFAQALPYVEPERGVWLSPLDNDLRTDLKVRGEAGYPWRDGIVTTLSTRRIQDFEAKGKKITVLYQDAGELHQAFAELTPAQMNRDFAELAAADEAARARRRVDYLNLRRLEAHLLRRALRARAARGDAGMAALLETQVRTETSLLATQLTQAGSWLPPGRPAPDPLARLRAVERDLLQDARFFQELARRKGAESLAGRLKAVVAAKTVEIARLEKL